MVVINRTGNYRDSLGQSQPLQNSCVSLPSLSTPVITSLAINQSCAPLGINYPSTETVLHAEWQKLPFTARKMSTSIKRSHQTDLSPVTDVVTRVTGTCHAQRNRDTKQIKIEGIIEEITP